MLPAARLGDGCLPDCKIPFVIISGSPDVVVNGRPFARLGDSVLPHPDPKAKCKKPHKPIIISGSASVIVNGQPAAHLGSKLLFCTFVTAGSPDVVVGT